MPVAVHLDHATLPALVAEAIELDLSSVMFDASRLPLEQNITATRVVAALCHDQGVLIEGELGEIGGKAGAHAPDARTDPGEAARYVLETGVDALAVAIGSQHAMTTQTARLDLDLLGRIRGLVPVPLVLHGSSGVPASELRRAVAAGITKVNVATLLSVAFTAAVRQVLTEEPETVDLRRYLPAARPGGRHRPGGAAAGEPARLTRGLCSPVTTSPISGLARAGRAGSGRRAARTGPGRRAGKSRRRRGG